MTTSWNRCGSQQDPCAQKKAAACTLPPCCPITPSKDHRNKCGRHNRVSTSAKIIENVLDIGSTLIRVLINCGIHECKAHKALDVIIYSFMFFEEVRDSPNKKCKKRIRKKEFLNDLMENCDMTKTEARMTYAITKAAFRAFYDQKLVMKYDANEIDPCDWRKAVEKTVEAFSQTGATRSEVEFIGQRICNAYNDYLTRRHTKKRGGQSICPGTEGCPFCVCREQGNDFQKTVCQEAQMKSCNISEGSNSSCSQKSATAAYKNFCSSWLKATADNPDPDEFPITPKTANLDGKLMGEYCMPVMEGCNDTTCNPVVVKDCLGRTYMMVQGNRVFFDPDILINEAKRVTADLKPRGSANCIC